MKIGKLSIGKCHEPLVIAEAGINHNGDFNKAKQLIRCAHNAGAKCIKFQCHVMDDEMLPLKHVKSIYNLLKRCSFNENQEARLKQYTEELGMEYLCTPFSRLAADRLNRLGVNAYKIGSGECSNFPLIKHIASFGKPVILSTGMASMHSIARSINILNKADIPVALLQCTSIYPTPYPKAGVSLMERLRTFTPIVGLSDHSIGNYVAFAAVAQGAAIIEKHFTIDNKWPGPDNYLSLSPPELNDLIIGCKAIYQALLLKDKKQLYAEKKVKRFAGASVVSIKSIKKGEKFTIDNLWVMKPGTGEFDPESYSSLIGETAVKNIKKHTQIKRCHIG